MAIVNPDTIWNLTTSLDEALRCPALSTWTPGQTTVEDQVANAAFRVATAMGRCRLFNFEPAEEELQCTISWEFADAALRGAGLQTVQLNVCVNQLVDDLAVADTPFERHAIVINILEMRLDLSACELAVCEAREEGVLAGEREPEWFQARLEAWRDLLWYIDQKLAACNELTIAGETEWCNNVAACLADEMLQPRPWWLTEELQTRWGEMQEHCEQFADDEETHAITLLPVESTSKPDVTAREDFWVFDLSAPVEPVSIMPSHPVEQADQPAEADFALAAETELVYQPPPASQADYTSQENPPTMEASVYLPSDWQSCVLNKLEDTVKLSLVITCYKRNQLSDLPAKSRWYIKWGYHISWFEFNFDDETPFARETCDVEFSAIRPVLAAGEWPRMFLERVG